MDLGCIGACTYVFITFTMLHNEIIAAAFDNHSCSLQTELSTFTARLEQTISILTRSTGSPSGTRNGCRVTNNTDDISVNPFDRPVLYRQVLRHALCLDLLLRSCYIQVDRTRRLGYHTTLGLQENLRLQ